MVKKSRAYDVALAQATQHHMTSKTYSGKFLRPHALIIKRLIDQTGARHVLDYGCGKGAQYEWVSHGGTASIPEGMTIQQFWDVQVFRYDPAFPPLATISPEEFITARIGGISRFDITLVTHVLGSIPINDLVGWVLPRLANLTEHAVYIAEKIGAVGKQVFADSTDMWLQSTMPRWEAPYWRGFIQGASVVHPNVAWYVSTLERTPAGKIMTLRGYKDGRELPTDRLMGLNL